MHSPCPALSYTRPHILLSHSPSPFSCPVPNRSARSASVYLSASSSAQTFLMCCLFSFAASRFCRVRSSRRPRRHMFTRYFASVQFPVTFHRKPRAWHSSSAATTSAQPRRNIRYWVRNVRRTIVRGKRVWKGAGFKRGGGGLGGGGGGARGVRCWAALTYSSELLRCANGDAC